jgi:hypothetical protein
MLVVSSDDNSPPSFCGRNKAWIYLLYKKLYFHNKNISDIIQPALILEVPE